jgi:sugar phosphate isomerase/epimerase
MKPSFSTVACPEWTFEHVAAAAEKGGWQGVELRTFGNGGTQLACEPALTAGEKLRAVFAKAGCEPSCIATSASFDAPIRPPVIGALTNKADAPIRHVSAALKLAVGVECNMVRVFGAVVQPGQARKATVHRIASRLLQVAQMAQNTGAQIAIENAGSFATAAELSEILDLVDHPLLGVAYCPALAKLAGEDPIAGLNVIGDRLLSVKLRDYRNGRPCGLGEGELPTRTVVEALGKADFRGWLVFEHDRLWNRDAAEPAAVLDAAARKLYEWIGGSTRTRGTRQLVEV